MIFKTIVIDDEGLARSRLVRLLKKHSDKITILAEAEDGQDAVDKINKHSPDLIFLDIQMPVYSGFEVIERLDKIPFIIFCTAYDEYALKAFEVNSIDYLLKPIESERLIQALNKLERLTSVSPAPFEGQVKNLLRTLSYSKLRRIQVRTGNSIKLINPDDIFFMKASDKYVEIKTFDKIYLVEKSLSAFEEILSPDNFIRCHRSYLVNVNKFDELLKMFNGNYKIKMKDKDKSEVPVSRSRKSSMGFL